MYSDWLRSALVLIAVAATCTVPDMPAAEAADSQVLRGQAVYQRCAGCHSLEVDRTGPRHCGVVGREAGALPTYEYSPALRSSGITWTEAALDAFLKAPLAMVPGTTMGFAGVADEQDRRSLIAYLIYASKELCHGPDNRQP